MNWYVIMAYSGYELKVKAALEERIALAGLKDQFGEILVPTESVVELKSGAKKKTERKFFPGYILIEMEMNDDTWQLVKHTPRVSSFVGGKKDKPSPISKSDVDNILNRIEVGEEASSPTSILLRMLSTSLLEMGEGLSFLPPTNELTLGVCFTNCQVSSFISISIKM